MTQRKANKRLDFETLRHGIERCDLDLMLGFYAEDAELKIVNAGAPQSSAFELRGKAEIAKHLRAAFGQGTSHRVEREIIGEEWVAFREACENPDGSRVAVETTLEVRRQDLPSGGRGGKGHTDRWRGRFRPRTVRPQPPAG